MDPGTIPAPQGAGQPAVPPRPISPGRVPVSTPGRAAPGVVSGDAPEEPGDEQVDGIIGDLERLIAGQRHSNAHVWHDRSVSKVNLFVLMLLEQFGAMPMGRLASMVDVSLPSLTGIVTRMEEHGLVERVRDETDRRIVLARSTPKGRETIREIEALRREYLRRLLGALDAAERGTCYEAFRALRRTAERLDADAVGDPRGAPPCDRPKAAAAHGHNGHR
jgi:MarR family transcriptional regulator, organic hydroperoxide resistance regulator